jgi:hypothetical protein
MLIRKMEQMQASAIHLLTLDPSVLANNLKHTSLYVIHENITFAAENLR